MDEGVAIIVLAAGSSSRMQGRDKLMEQVDGMPLLRRTVLRAQATGRPVLVTLPPPPHARYGALSGLEVDMVPVMDAARGMSASLRAGLIAVPPKAQAVMVLLADMPDLTVQDMTTVLQAVDTDSEILIWRGATIQGEAGHPLVFDRVLLPQLIALEGDRGGHEVVRSYHNRTSLIRLPADHARTDLDTPGAWDAWRARQPAIS